MERIVGILKPLFGAALILGGARLVVELLEGPALGVYLFSLTGLQAVAMGYLPWRFAREPNLGLHHLWVSLTSLFGFSQLVYGATVFASHALGRLNPQTLGMNRSAGIQDLASHLFLHLQVWVLALPLLVTVVVGLPLFALMRRWPNLTESDNI